MNRKIKYAAVTILFFYGCTGSQVTKSYYSHTAVNFSTNIKSLEEQNNESLKNAISLLIMSKNGDIHSVLSKKLAAVLLNTRLNTILTLYLSPL